MIDNYSGLMLKNNEELFPTTYVFDYNWKIVAEIDFFGDTKIYNYDEDGKLISFDYKLKNNNNTILSNWVTLKNNCISKFKLLYCKIISKIPKIETQYKIKPKWKLKWN